MVAALFSIAAGVFLSLLFLTAAVHKLAAPRRFTAVLEAQDIVPRWGLGVGAYAIPIVELGIGVGLLIEDVRPAAALAGAIVLAAYGAGFAINLHRGRLALDCGCSFLAERPLSMSLLWRNGALAVLALLVWGAPAGASLGVLASGNAAAAGLAVFLIYLALEALAVTHGRLASMRTRV